MRAQDNSEIVQRPRLTCDVAEFLEDFLALFELPRRVRIVSLRYAQRAQVIEHVRLPRLVTILTVDVQRSAKAALRSLEVALHAIDVAEIGERFGNATPVSR
ncbi:MAG TPA: hypothetical protein VGK04_07390 [Thermoanaerobaculia bacterium]